MRTSKLQRRGWLMGLTTILLVTIAFEAPARMQAGSTINVTTTVQGVDELDGQCSLEEAIYSANFNSNIAIKSTNPDTFVSTPECTAGSGDDTIVLSAGAVFLMNRIVDDAHNELGPTATPIIFSNITIEANGARLEHSGTALMRAFAVTSNTSPGAGLFAGTGHLTIRNAHIKGFAVKGGNGGLGGGGGLGAGGAIYVREAGLTVENSTFEGNGAAGGNGSHSNGTLAGGGGGLGGNGGIPGDVHRGGGGGGGSRGNGGTPTGHFGGGGGGTVTSGINSQAGFACGGAGGAGSGAQQIPGGGDGGNGSCAGGGGGGGEARGDFLASLYAGNGGSGNYGGGGGGSGWNANGGNDGGHGGFGGGGGSGQTFQSNLNGFGPTGGNGGFGGGGGAGYGGYFGLDGGPGDGGTFAGDASQENGGGGAGLGGAIFSDAGNVTVRNSTFTGNYAVRGVAGGTGAQNGGDAGGAIFAVDGVITVLNSTLSANETTGVGAGIVVYRSTRSLYTASFTLRNTIIANSLPTVRECFYLGGVSAVGSGNLITANFGCPGNITAFPADPALGPLQVNAPGNTPTMAIDATSAARDAGDDDYCSATDQRGVLRAALAPCDIGAFEVEQPPDFTISPIGPITMVVGGNSSTDVGVNSVASFSGAVQLAAASDPGIYPAFSPNPVSVPVNGTGTSSMTIGLPVEVPAGTYVITITATSGAPEHSTTATLNVIATVASVAGTVDGFGALGCIDSGGLVNALKAKLNVAQTLSDNGLVQPAVNTLSALRYQIVAQRGKHILSSCTVGGQTIDPGGVLLTNVTSLIQSMSTAAPNPLMGYVVSGANTPVVGATVTLSGNGVTTTATTDALGFYYFSRTAGLKTGTAYQVSVPVSDKKKAGTSTLQFTWSGAMKVLSNLVQ